MAEKINWTKSVYSFRRYWLFLTPQSPINTRDNWPQRVKSSNLLSPYRIQFLFLPFVQTCSWAVPTVHVLAALAAAPPLSCVPPSPVPANLARGREWVDHPAVAGWGTWVGFWCGSTGLRFPTALCTWNERAIEIWDTEFMLFVISRAQKGHPTILFIIELLEGINMKIQTHASILKVRCELVFSQWRSYF